MDATTKAEWVDVRLGGAVLSLTSEYSLPVGQYLRGGVSIDLNNIYPPPSRLLLVQYRAIPRS